MALLFVSGHSYRLKEKRSPVATHKTCRYCFITATNSRNKTPMRFVFLNVINIFAKGVKR